MGAARQEWEVSLLTVKRLVRTADKAGAVESLPPAPAGHTCLVELGHPTPRRRGQDQARRCCEARGESDVQSLARKHIVRARLYSSRSRPVEVELAAGGTGQMICRTVVWESLFAGIAVGISPFPKLTQEN